MTLLLSDFINYEDLKIGEQLESELLGFLKAHFNTFLARAIIHEQVKIGNNLRPDFLIEYGGDKIILEIKKMPKVKSIEPVIYQLLTYLEYSQIQKGIALVLDFSKSFNPMNIQERIIERDDLKYTVRIIGN